MAKSRIIFDSPISKLLGEKLAMKLGLAVEVFEGENVNEGHSRPQGQSHTGTDETTASEDRSSAREASKRSSMNEEWERFREDDRNGR